MAETTRPNGPPSMSPTGPDTEPELIDLALDAAVRAPSPHNTQPWCFRRSPGHVEVFLDRARILTVADPDAREARLACGAAIFNMRSVLCAAGRATDVQWQPNRADPDHLARLWVGGHTMATPADRALAAAVRERRSHRRPFSDEPMAPGDRRALTRAAAAEGAELLVLDRPADIAAIVGLIRRADHMQRTDPRFLAELREWTTGRPGRQDGVPALADRAIDEQAVLALRDFGAAAESAPEHRPVGSYESQPRLAVLRSYTDTAVGQLRCGQAMQRVLLTATARGLSASFLSQPIEVAATRIALRQVLGGRGFPQAIVRLGYGSVAAASPRRRPPVIDDREPGEPGTDPRQENT